MKLTLNQKPPHHITGPYHTVLSSQPYILATAAGQRAGDQAGLQKTDFHPLPSAGNGPACHLPWISVMRCHGAGGPTSNIIEMNDVCSALEHCWLFLCWWPACIMAIHDV